MLILFEGRKSSFSNTWLFRVTSAPAENTFQTVNPFFSPSVLTLRSSLQFWSSVRISLTTKCLAKIMPFPETVHNLSLLKFKCTCIPKKIHSHGRKSQIKVEYARHSWIQKFRMTLWKLSKE